MPEGLSQNHRNDIADQYAGGTVHLLETTLADDDGAGDLDANSEAEASTSDSDWTITHDNAAGTTVLENADAINFGTPGDITINQIVLQSADDPDNLLLDPDPEGDTELDAGDEYEIPEEGVEYTLGGE